jgi:hypothetical protein
MKSSKKILFYIYIIFLVFLTVNMLNKPKPITPVPIRIITDTTKYTLPKIPVISLANDTDVAIIVDTCRDMTLTVNGIKKPESLTGFCRVIEVPAKSTTPLIGMTKEDIIQFQEAFAPLTEKATLRFDYTSPDAVVSEATVTVAKAGWFRLFFRTVFYNPVYNLLAALILIFPGYSLGFAIVAITIVIRLILLVPQQHMLVSQRKMQTIQPKIKAIQDAHKGDQATIGMKMMELYKKE